jgi:hypothetical protein
MRDTDHHIFHYYGGHVFRDCLHDTYYMYRRQIMNKWRDYNFPLSKQDLFTQQFSNDRPTSTNLPIARATAHQFLSSGRYAVMKGL